MAALAAAASSALPAQAAENPAWNDALAALRAAQCLQDEALKAFNAAERRYFSLSKRRRRGEKPSWYVEAERAEAATGSVVEESMLMLARLRTTTREGLVIKARLLAAAYGLSLGSGVSDDDDLVACLISSLLDDLAPLNESA